MNKKKIYAEAENFFEWPDPARKDIVTTTSCVIFAAVIAEMAVAAERERCAQIAERGDDGDWSASTGDYDAQRGMNIARVIRGPSVSR